MSGVGPYGGYGPWIPGVGSPPGPSMWPGGQTWPLRSSKQVFANDLNQQLSQPVTFLARKPCFQGYQATVQAIATGVETPIILDTETSDGWFMHNVDADTSQVVIPSGADGVYLVQGLIPFAASATGFTYQADIQLNGAVLAKGERWEAAGTHTAPGVADLILCKAGDSLQLSGFQSSGASVNTFVQTGPVSGVQWASNGFPQLTLRWGGFGGANQGLSPPGTGGLAIPSPSTWTTLEEATSSLFNSDIRNSINFLSYVPYFRSAQSTAVSVPNAVLTSMGTSMAATLDNYGTGGGATWTAPIAGLYLVGGQVAFTQFASVFSGNASLSVTTGGSSIFYSGAKGRGTNVATMVMRTLRLNAGDTVALYGFQNTGSTITTQTGANTRLFSLWLSS